MIWIYCIYESEYLHNTHIKANYMYEHIYLCLRIVYKFLQQDPLNETDLNKC